MSDDMARQLIDAVYYLTHAMKVIGTIVIALMFIDWVTRKGD